MKSVNETKEELIQRIDNLNLNMTEWELLYDDGPVVKPETLLRDFYQDIHIDILKLFSLSDDESFRNAAKESLKKLSTPDKEYRVIQNNEQLKQMIAYLQDNNYHLFQEDQVLVLDPKTKTADIQPLHGILKEEEQARNPNKLQAILQSPNCPISLVNQCLEHENKDLQNTARTILEQRHAKENVQEQLHDKYDRSLDERLNDARQELHAQHQETQEKTIEKQQNLER